ncbi:MAG: hypothetical protein AB7F50_06490 [Fimbriimonadaceae bacterium]
MGSSSHVGGRDQVSDTKLQLVCPNNGTVPHASLICKFDSTHWRHDENVQFWVYATDFHQGQVTSIQPILVATRPVYNAAVAFQHKQLALGAGGAGYASSIALWNHKITQAVTNNSWTAAQYATGLGPATSHFVLAHGTPGEIHPPVEPSAINDGIVQGGVPGGPFPLYFAFLASCRVAENVNDALPNAYLSDLTGTNNRCVVAFKFSITNAEANALFAGIVLRALDGYSVETAAEDEWDAMDLTNTYNRPFSQGVLIAGDGTARPRSLYNGTHTNRKGIWKDNR